MNKSWVWVLLVLSLGVNVGILATIGLARLKGPPQWEPNQWEDPPGQEVTRERFSPPIDRMANALRLEGETREEFLAIQEEFFRSIVEQRQGLGQIRHQLRSEVVADEPDLVRIESLLAELGQGHSNLDRAMVENVLRNREILDPEQQQHYFRMLQRIREAMDTGGRRRGEGSDDGRGFGGRGPDGRRPGDGPPRRRPDRRPPG